MDYSQFFQAIIGLCAGLGAYFAAMAKLEAQRAKKEASSANRAVNHTGPGDTRIYDLVSNTHDRVGKLETQCVAFSATLADLPCQAERRRQPPPCDHIDRKADH